MQLSAEVREYLNDVLNQQVAVQFSVKWENASQNLCRVRAVNVNINTPGLGNNIYFEI